MRFFEWIQKRSNGRKIGKSDWIILILVGVLLMVVVWPTGGSGDDSSSSLVDSGNTSGSNAESSGQLSAVAANEKSDSGNAEIYQDSDADVNMGAGAAASTDSNGSNDGSSSGSAGNDANSSGSRDNASNGAVSSYESVLEEKLEELLGAMEGVGEVRVMITLEDDGETVLQTDSTKSDDSSSESTVILEQGDDERPYITSQLTLSVQGVVVVAEGAGSGSVTVEITEAVMALFGIEAHKVKVMPMG